MTKLMKTAAFRFALLAFVLAGMADATEAGTYATITARVQAMEEVFHRSEKAHKASMATIMHGMSNSKALGVLQRSNETSPQLLQLAHTVLGKKAHLRHSQPKGYSGIDGARKMLNSMIYQSMLKYDQEIAQCTEYYSEQCAAMEVCRGSISASNFIAANSRSLILDSQACINKCEDNIPTRKQELSQHNLKCKHEVHKMRERLKIVLGDIAVMTTILKMTDCKKSMMQMNLMRCEDECTHKKFVTFSHLELKQKVSQLQSSVSHELMQSTFSDMFEGIEGLQRLAQAPVNKTAFSNPPVPRTGVPKSPCSDPYQGAPSASDKRAAKCVLSSGNCVKLQERFLLIQSGIEDERDELLTQIDRMEKDCEQTKNTLETQIADDESTLSSCQTKLADATTKEATAGEEARQTGKKHEQLEGDLHKQMKSCSGNYIAFESELCALKKIRGELYKMQGSAKSAFFVDCQVSKWDPEECSAECGGGSQKLTRNVMTHPNGGAGCLPLDAVKSCNNQPCPVDCRLGQWSGWSKCSAECGGGVSQRLREVKRAMKHGGKPCGESSETVACNAQACEKDCDLSDWTAWTTCSKDCDGGTMKRSKFVTQEPQGEGKCPDKWSIKRLQYKPCNMNRCILPAGKLVMECNRTLDVILLIDGSGSLGSDGWKAEIKAAVMFVDAFKNSGGKTKMSVILYSGPSTWALVHKCTGRNKNKIDQEAVCKIKTITHFTEDMKKVKQMILNLDWPKGSTLTSLALATAKAELALGRKDALANVIVITDGRPLSYSRTLQASRDVRKSARLVWVPVTKYAPLKKIKRWATRRWQENTVVVKSFKDLESPDTVTRIVANICPKERGATSMFFKRR